MSKIEGGGIGKVVVRSSVTNWGKEGEDSLS